MTTIGHGGYCPRCGAQLRRDQRRGAVCDPCGRAGPDPLPPEFYLPEPVRAALLAYDFGRFLRRVRGYQQWSQEVAQRLGIPAPLLGFGDPATVGGGVSAGRKGSWMQRRDFVQHIATLALGAAGGSALDVDRLVALLYPDADATGTRRIGLADVEALEHATAGYERTVFTFGGAVARETAVSQLRAVLPLLKQPMDDNLGPRLHIAATHLALISAWMSFDVEHHDAARRLWSVGLETARATEHPLATDLASHLLFCMPQQALYLRRPDEAERLLQLGHTAGVGAPPVSPSTSTAMAANAAFAHAARGDRARVERALGTAEEAFTRIDQTTATPWACVDGPVKLATWQGHAYYELGRASGDQRGVARAVALLAQVVENPRPMSRALYLPDLAGAHALAGDVGTAVAVGHQAVGTVTEISSRRTYDRLRVLHTVLEPMHAGPGVAELRERLALAA